MAVVTKDIMVKRFKEKRIRQIHLLSTSNPDVQEMFEENVLQDEPGLDTRT